MRVLPLLLAVFLVSDPAAAGKLDQVRDEVSGSDSGSDSSSSSSDYCDDDDDDDYYYDDDDSDIAAEALVTLLFFPFFVPFNATDDCYGGDYVYAWYPYASNQSSSLTSTCVAVPDGPTVGQSWSLQVMADVVPQVSDDILRFSGSVRVQTPMRFELDSTWSHFRENLGGGDVDSLTIGDLNFVARFAQSSTTQFRVGIGARVMLDETDYVGFNFTYGFDWFPVEPWVFSASLDAGNLGFAGYFQGRFTAGVTVLGGEIFGGWDHIQIGSASLTGPVVGARFWF